MILILLPVLIVGLMTLGWAAGEGTNFHNVDLNRTLNEIFNVQADFVNVDISSYLDFDEISAPLDPTANVGRIYIADDGGTTTPYFVDSAGTATSMIVGGAGAATDYNDIGNPDGNGSIDFTTYTNTWDMGGVVDMFVVELTGAFGDISGMKIEQKTGNPTDGTLLELALAAAETDPDFLSCAIGGVEVYNIADDGSVVMAGSLDVSDQNITNVGSIELDSISPDATSITICATAADDVSIGNSTGNVAVLGDNVDFTLTDATDNVYQLVNSGGAILLDVDLGAVDLITLGDPSVKFALDSDTIDISNAGAITGATGITTTSTVDADDFTCNVSAGLDTQTGGALLLGAATATSVEINDSGQLTDIQGTLSVDEAATFDATVSFDDNIDIDLIAADQVHISSTDVASGTAGLVVIDDNRTGTNNDVVAEAALVVDSTGVFGASFVDGRVAFATGADLDINASIDYDTAVAGELINIAGFGDAGIDLVTISKANDGTEANDGNVLVIDDNRTGTEVDVVAEAAVTIDSTGAFALSVIAGDTAIADTLDWDAATAGEIITIDSTDVATTTPLVAITDLRDGINNDVVGEASLQISAVDLNTFALSVTAGRTAIAGILDWDGAEAGEVVTIDSTDVATLTSLVEITDLRAGVNNDTAAEASLAINSSGTFALSITSGTADFDDSIDFDAATAGEVVTVDSTDVATTTGLVEINDLRTGVNSDTAAEASLIVNSAGTYSAFFEDGSVLFAEEADIVIEETGGTDLVTFVAIAQTTSATASIPDIGAASTFVMSTTQGSAAQAVDGAFDADSLTVDAGAGLDAQAGGALLIGAVTATSVEIADAGVATDIQGDVTIDGNTTIGDAATDTVTVTAEILGATPLTFEGATADNVYTIVGIDDPTVERTITLPDYSGAIPIVIYNGTATVDCTGVGTTTEITGSELTLADGWFSAGKSLKWTIYGRSDGSGSAAMTLQISVDGAAFSSVALTTGQSDSWYAEFILDEHTAFATQDIVGILHANTDPADVTVATDTTDFNDGGTTVVKLQGVTNSATDHIYCDHIRIEHFNK